MKKKYDKIAVFLVLTTTRTKNRRRVFSNVYWSRGNTSEETKVQITIWKKCSLLPYTYIIIFFLISTNCSLISTHNVLEYVFLYAYLQKKTPIPTCVYFTVIIFSSLYSEDLQNDNHLDTSIFLFIDLSMLIRVNKQLYVTI